MGHMCQRGGGGGADLRADQAGDAVHEAEVPGHLEALVEGVDVAEVAAGYNNPIRNLPVKLLQDLDRRRLLALEPEGVH